MKAELQKDKFRLIPENEWECFELGKLAGSLKEYSVEFTRADETREVAYLEFKLPELFRVLFANGKEAL